MPILKLSNTSVIIFTSVLCIWLFPLVNVKAQLLSYQSEYEISLGDSDIVRVPGKTYVDKASGNLFIDWINNCDSSWVSNQRMMTRFVNSYGVGTVNEINYSINENQKNNTSKDLSKNFYSKKIVIIILLIFFILIYFTFLNDPEPYYPNSIWLKK